MLMEISLIQTDGAAELKLAGELDMKSSVELRKALRDLVSNRTPTIVVNLGAVPYVDSSGLATLIECMQGVRGYQGRLQLSGVNARNRAVFELARLDKVFDIRSE